MPPPAGPLDFIPEGRAVVHRNQSRSADPKPTSIYPQPQPQPGPELETDPTKPAGVPSDSPNSAERQLRMEGVDVTPPHPQRVISESSPRTATVEGVQETQQDPWGAVDDSFVECYQKLKSAAGFVEESGQFKVAWGRLWKHFATRRDEWGADEWGADATRLREAPTHVRPNWGERREVVASA